MSLSQNTPGIRPAQVPIFRFDEQRACDAYAVHTALLDTEKRYPSLKANPAWQIVRADAYENFALAFGGEA